MAPPNYFRFVAKDYIDPGPTEDNPRYVSWGDYQFGHDNGAYDMTHNDWFEPELTGSGHANLPTNIDYSYLIATGSVNGMNINSGAVYWEFQPDAENGFPGTPATPTEESQGWGWASALEWRFRPYRQFSGNYRDNAFHHNVDFDTNGTYVSDPAVVSSWTVRPRKGNSNSSGAERTLTWFSPANNSGVMRRRPSEFQFRFKLWKSHASREDYVNMKIMVRHTASSYSWQDLEEAEAGVQADDAISTVTGVSTGWSWDTDEKSIFYPGIIIDDGTNRNPDFAFKYFTMWHGANTYQG